MTKEQEIVQILTRRGCPMSARELTDIMYNKNQHQSAVFNVLRKMKQIYKDTSVYPHLFSLKSEENFPCNESQQPIYTESSINSQNPKTGRDFETAVCLWFKSQYNKDFYSKPIGIGNPPKLHNFDLVSDDNSIVIECKCYSWTESGNVPSAKMGFVNEAVFYLSFISNADTYVVLKKAIHPRRAETLADYYYRTNKHLLGQTKVLEYDVELSAMREIRK